MSRITSRQNPLVLRFRTAARGDDRDGLILLDGPHLVGEALAAGLALVHALVASDDARPDTEAARLALRLGRTGCEVVGATAAVLEAASPVSHPGGIVALARPPKLDITRLFDRDRPCVIACDVQDPGNLGAIVRAAEAAGAAGVVAAGQCADPFGWKALRGAMGSTLRLPVARRKDVAEAVAEARRHGCRIVATVPRDGEVLFGAPLHGACAFLLGAEGAGLPRGVVEQADLRVTIPMNGPVESLNVAVAAALLLYEARRQRPSASQ